MSAVVSGTKRGSSSSPINVNALRSLMGEVESNGYELYPHFLVKIFNIANTNERVKDYLLGGAISVSAAASSSSTTMQLSVSEQNFYTATRRERLEIVKRRVFFNLLSVAEKEALFSSKEYSKFLQISQMNRKDINESNIRYIARQAIKFKNIDDYLKTTRFYEFYHRSPRNIEGLTDIISSVEFKKMLSENNTAYSEYLQHVESEFVANETSTGACIDINKMDNRYRQPREEAEREGHWKLHVGIDMERCGQDKIDVAYDIVLRTMQEYNISALKVVAPYADVKSMKGKEFSTYLQNQMIIPVSGSKDNVRKFISEVEKLFNENGILPRLDRDVANKPIMGSIFFSYRNERARVINIPEQNNLPRIQGNAIVIYGNKVHFVKNGEWVLNTKGRLFEKTRNEMMRQDITLIDGEYISAEGCENLTKLLKLDERHSYNPFGYQDNKFTIGQIELPSRDKKAESEANRQSRLEAARTAAQTAAATSTSLYQYAAASSNIIIASHSTMVASDEAPQTSTQQKQSRLSKRFKKQ